MRRSRLLTAASLAAIVPLVLAASGTAAGATGPGSGNKIVINALFSQYSNFDGLTEILTKRGAEFEKAHPQYQVNVQFANYQQLPEDVAKDAQNGAVPTIASYNTSGTRFALDTLDKNGKPVFTPVAPAIAGRKSILGEPVVANDLLPAASRYYSYRGQLFAMPLSISTLQLYANMTLLKKAGVQSIPRTYAEVTAACAAIAKLNPAPAHCVGFADEAKLFQQAMTQTGTPLVNNDNGRSNRATTVDLNSPQMVAYATWWQQLNRAGYFLNTGKIEDWAGTFGAFATQQVAFTETSSFVVGIAEQTAKTGGFELGVGPSPSSQASSAGTWLGGDGMYLAAGLDPATRDGALAFMQFLDNPKNGAEWQQVYGSAPVTNGVFHELKAEGFYNQNPGDLVTVQQLKATADDPGGQPALVGAFAGIQESLMRAFDDVVTNNADPVERLNRAESEAQELLTDYNAHCLVTGVVPDYCYALDT
jgi:sn-glycerol 3-phosphate transport system substrate-binding protein